MTAAIERIRFALALTSLLAAIYAFSSLLSSLAEFAVGLTVSAAALIAYGAIGFIGEPRAVSIPARKAAPSDREIQRLRDRLLDASRSHLRAGGRITYPTTSVHQQVVNDTIGGSWEWEELITPLRQLPPFVWPS